MRATFYRAAANPDFWDLMLAAPRYFSAFSIQAMILWRINRHQTGDCKFFGNKDYIISCYAKIPSVWYIVEQHQSWSIEHVCGRN
ncbi:hypothetical protein CapIbe_001249 [Capra ibex]